LAPISSTWYFPAHQNAEIQRAIECCLAAIMVRQNRQNWRGYGGGSAGRSGGQCRSHRRWRIEV
jgi:hypothetical protein